MALTEQEKALGRQIKSQGGNKDDFREALQEFRSRQSQTTTPQPIANLDSETQRRTAIPQVGEGSGISGTVSPAQLTEDSRQTLENVFAKSRLDRQREATKETEEGLTGFISETGEALKQRTENLAEISETLKDKRNTTRQEIGKLIDEGRPLAALGASFAGTANQFGSQLQRVGQGAGAIGDVIWEAVENTVQEFTPEQAENFVEDSLAKAVNTQSAQTIADSYSSFRENKPETARNLEAVVNIGGLLGGLTKSGREGLKTAASETIKAPVTIPTKGTAALIRTITPKNIAQNLAGIDDITKTVLNKTTKKELDDVLKIAEDSITDIDNPTPFGKAGDKAIEALDELNLQKSLAGKAKSEALKEVADKVIDVQPLIDKLDNMLAERFNLRIGGDGRLVSLKGEIGIAGQELQPFVNDLQELLTVPKGKMNLKNLDAFVDNLQATINQAKINRPGAQLTTAEKNINSFIEGTINNTLKKEAGEKFMRANADFKKLAELVGDLDKALGVGGNKAEGLFKSIFSPQTGQRTRNIFSEVKNLTGIDLSKESVLAKFAMEALGDTRGLNLLETAAGVKSGYIDPSVFEKIGKSIFTPEKVAKSMLNKTK